MAASTHGAAAANKAPASQLAIPVISEYTVTKGGQRYEFTVALSSDLTDWDRVSIWNIYAENMRNLFQGTSLGWDPSSKKLELFHIASRFILVKQCNRDAQDGQPPAVELTPPLIVAYAIFRFDREVDEEVIYCYELQVSKMAKRTGIGRQLVAQLQATGVYWKIGKVMLTVLKSYNVEARKFYYAVGFSLDHTSPEYVEGDVWVDDESEDNNSSEYEFYDYEILSMPCTSTVQASA